MVLNSTGVAFAKKTNNIYRYVFIRKWSTYFDTSHIKNTMKQYNHRHMRVTQLFQQFFTSYSNQCVTNFSLKINQRYLKQSTTFCQCRKQLQFIPLHTGTLILSAIILKFILFHDFPIRAACPAQAVLRGKSRKETIFKIMAGKINVLFMYLIFGLFWNHNRR